MRVLVGMSGGVDSSMAALLLKEQGFEVIGATMSHWGKSGIYKEIEEKISTNSKQIAHSEAVSFPEKNKTNSQKKTSHCACLSPDENEDIEAAGKTAEKLGIEFHVIDCSKDYEEIVINYFKSEYMSGRTPNPCICCNRYIKFGVFPNLARKAGIQFDKFATGHYAKIVYENGRYNLKCGIDPKKDQSYFLYGLAQEQLASILLPLGDYKKEEIRELARKNGFEAADKPDSQDFYNGDYNDILNAEPKKGNIVDINGNILGTHDGFWNFTIGQRKGIGIAAKAPLYVVELRKDTNEVVAAYKEESLNKGLIASNINFIAIDKLENSLNCKVKIRSSQEPKEAVIKPLDNGKVEVVFSELQSPIATGQSAVFYNNDTVIGGGIIEKVFA